MANWALTSYLIEGSKKDLERIYNIIDNFMSGRQDPVETGASGNWEGNILKTLGATEGQLKNNYLRGFIQEYEMDEGVILIEAEEAWGDTDFRHVLKTLMPELTIYFITEEPGCEVYITNDADGKYFPCRFYVQSCIDGNYEEEYFEDETEAMEYIAPLIGKEKINKADLEAWNKQHEDDYDYVYVHEFEVVDC